MSEGILARLRRHPAYWYVVYALCAVVALAFVAELAHLWQGYQYGSPGTGDFIEYWSAGQLLREGESPYDFVKLYQRQLELGSRHEFPIIMWNPPWLLLWIYPLLLLPFLSAALVWVAVSGSLLLLSATLIWQTLATPPARRLIGIAWLATFAFIPTLLTLRMGQMSSLILLGVAGFLYLASRGRDFGAGMCLALTTIKPHVVYLLWIGVAWWVIKERRWKIVAGGAALLLATLAVLTLLWPGWLSGYRAAFAPEAREGVPLPIHWGTTTLGGILRWGIFTKQEWAQFLPPLLGAAFVLGYLLVKRPVLDWRKSAGPLLLISVPTAAYGWPFDQVVLLVPYLEIIVWIVEGSIVGTVQKALILAGLLLIAAGMVTQNLLAVTDLFFFWVPLALAAVYVAARMVRRRDAG
jgi:hypothetical protein